MAQNKNFSLGGIGHPCCCSANTTNRTFIVVGCDDSLFGVGHSGLWTVTVYDATGVTLLGSASNDTTGHATVAIPSADTTCKVLVNASAISARWVDYSAVIALGTTTTIHPTAASGYTCNNLCPLPLKNTLTITMGTAEVRTLTFASGSWSGSCCTGIIGGAVCTGFTIAFGTNGFLTIIETGITSCTSTVTSVACPPAVSISGTIADTTGTDCVPCTGGSFTITE